MSQKGQNSNTRMDERFYPPIHEHTKFSYSFERLDMLWERYPKYHEMTCFTTLDNLLEEHESYQEDFQELRAEYLENQYDRFLIQLSWSDLPYRQATRRMIEEAGELTCNPFVQTFLDQFSDLNTDTQACFLFPESFTTQFFVISEVCKHAERFHPINNFFPDEKQIHYLAVFDKRNMDDILLMYHLLYTNTSEKVFGGYSLYDYSLPWYHNHLWENQIVLRSPYLPDRLARFQGNLPYYHNPAKIVYVRRNITHMLEMGYFSSELEFFRNLTEHVMPFFQWWYQDLALYEEKDGMKTNWRLERTKIRTRLTAEGIINPKWKHELSLFHTIRALYPDTLYQYRPEWLGRQSLDLYIPSLNTAIEYQGIQHYHPVSFFGGEEALEKRKELDKLKKQLCEEHRVRLIEWPYGIAPSAKQVKEMLQQEPDAVSGSDFI